jgi:hypothetical protein
VSETRTSILSVAIEVVGYLGPRIVERPERCLQGFGLIGRAFD